MGGVIGAFILGLPATKLGIIMDERQIGWYRVLNRTDEDIVVRIASLLGFVLGALIVADRLL